MDKTITITGSYDLGKNFSWFTKYLLQFYMDKIDYKLPKSEMDMNEINENGNTQEVFLISLIYKKLPV